MVRPLNGQREVFRRLEEREEGRARRQWEREELMGVEHEVEPLEYHTWDTMGEIDRYLQGYMRQQQIYNAYAIPRQSGNNIRGLSSQYAMWDEYSFSGLRAGRVSSFLHEVTHPGFDDLFGRSRGPADVQQYAEIVAHGNNGRDYTLRMPIPRVETSRYQEVLEEYRRSRDPLWFGGGLLRHVNDFFVGMNTMYYDPFASRIVRRAAVYKKDGEETVVFGAKESFVRELMENMLFEFFGLTDKEIKIKRMKEAQASMKSFTKLLLRKEKY